MWRNLIGLCVSWEWRWRWGRWGWGLWSRAIQVLDAFPVIITELQWVSEAVEGRHDGPRHKRVLQAQYMTKLMSCHLQQVCAYRDDMEGWEVNTEQCRAKHHLTLTVNTLAHKHTNSP